MRYKRNQSAVTNTIIGIALGTAAIAAGSQIIGNKYSTKRKLGKATKVVSAVINDIYKMIK